MRFGQPIPASSVKLTMNHYKPLGTPGVRLEVEVRPDGKVEVNVQDGPGPIVLNPGDLLTFDVGVQTMKAEAVQFTATSYVVRTAKEPIPD